MDGKGVVVCDVEGEVAGLAIEGGVAGDPKGLGVVEDDVGVLMGDACIEPREAAAGELHLSWIDGLKGGVGGGDVALQLALDVGDVAFKCCDEGDEEWPALRCDDL